MIINNTGKELAKAERYAINWFEENGYDGELVKVYNEKAVFVIKNGDEDAKVEIPSLVTNPKKYMTFVKCNLDAHRKLQAAGK